MNVPKIIARQILLGVAVVALLVPMIASCDNPFDPLEETSDIRGLAYYDWSASWERWDSDPEYDGIEIIMEYFNEYGDSLEFRKKPHTIQIEFYTQKTENQEIDPLTGDPVTGTGYETFDELIFTHTVTFENSDDEIRIPKESYEDALRAMDFDIDNEDAIVYIIVRIFPPDDNLVEGMPPVGYPDQVVYKPDTGVTPNP